jgi:hypothetical protein
MFFKEIPSRMSKSFCRLISTELLDGSTDGISKVPCSNRLCQMANPVLSQTNILISVRGRLMKIKMSPDIGFCLSLLITRPLNPSKPLRISAGPAYRNNRAEPVKLKSTTRRLKYSNHYATCQLYFDLGRGSCAGSLT